MTAMKTPALASSEFLRDVLAGLARVPRSLPCKYFYDERGSALFDRICELPEYYPTRTELAILRAEIDAIAAAIGPGAVLIEYGSGSSIKTRLLLDALPQLAAYVPVDISREHLLRCADRLARDYPKVPIVPAVADFTRPFALPQHPPGRRVVYFSGSTIGNFAPTQARQLLRLIARQAEALLIGVDLHKDTAILEPAYDDAQGVTAAFNLNLLARINRELGGTFDLASWQHRAFYDERHGRIEMHLVSLRTQRVCVGGVTLWFSEGETICTEHSHKYSLPGFADLCRRAGLDVTRVWTDPAGLFSVQFAQVSSSRGVRARGTSSQVAVS